MRTCLKRFVNRIDILFIGGDFANIQHKDIEEEEEEMEKTEKGSVPMKRRFCRVFLICVI